MKLTAQAGLTLVAETLMPLGAEELVSSELRLRKRQRGHSEFDRVQAIVMLLSAGGKCVEDVRKLREDTALPTLLLRPTPSPDALYPNPSVSPPRRDAALVTATERARQ